jgi:hypothetical protein
LKGWVVLDFVERGGRRLEIGAEGRRKTDLLLSLGGGRTSRMDKDVIQLRAASALRDSVMGNVDDIVALHIRQTPDDRGRYD